ncbi:hypothetical protein M7775_07755 [Sporomusa sphaeroides DSM 2875]|uniref:hypothetical protein n=1 Tax=Sporomusa sphaeroides TaxID=47679 RepID=UPI00202F8C74|nr:hypothetical protein [Sporomusa sphaeroides]MCM0758467.1 hypothetical protein [Sporomusa sphaeroides DSM 2875]
MKFIIRTANQRYCDTCKNKKGKRYYDFCMYTQAKYREKISEKRKNSDVPLCSYCTKPAAYNEKKGKYYSLCSVCRELRVKYNKKYYNKNIDYSRKYNREYYQKTKAANKEKIHAKYRRRILKGLSEEQLKEEIQELLPKTGKSKRAAKRLELIQEELAERFNSPNE